MRSLKKSGVFKASGGIRRAACAVVNCDTLANRVPAQNVGHKPEENNLSSAITKNKDYASLHQNLVNWDLLQQQCQKKH